MTPSTATTRPAPPCAITALDAGALSEAIHARRLSCREVMQAYLARIAALNPGYNAIVSLRPEAELLAEAGACDAELARGRSRGWMHGMPQAIKDLANAAGLPTTLGSPLMKHFVASEDGLMTARMKAAGCIVIGKTNTPEFGLGSHSFNEVFGTTVNAYDPARAAGGSSGGAAVALALRLLPVADGSDFMGSLRNPAAWNNIFGFRPSQGRVPMWPAQDVWISQLGTEGPMGRSVRDVARLLDTQAGWSPHSPLSIAASADAARAIGSMDLKKCRIGWLGDLQGYLPMEPGIVPLCEAALARLAGAGAQVAPARLGMSPERVWEAWLVWRRVLVATRIAPFLLKSGNRARRLAAERIAMNAPIQGTAADLLKLAMLAVAEPVTPGTRMVLTVHDELVFEVPEAEVEDAKKRVKKAMEGVYPLSVPLVVDVGAGDSWKDAH